MIAAISDINIQQRYIVKLGIRATLPSINGGLLHTVGYAATVIGLVEVPELASLSVSFQRLPQAK